MRTALLALTLQLAACTCGRPLSMYCKAGVPCEDAAATEKRALWEAEKRWLEGDCSGVQSGTCRGGGTWIIEGDGFCHTTTYFDRSGALSLIETGCEGDNTRYGHMRDCEATRTRDLCSETRGRVRLRHFEATSSELFPVMVDGAGITAKYGRSTFQLAPGPHVVSIDGHALELGVAEIRTTGAVELQWTTWDPALKLVANGAPVKAGPTNCLRFGDCSFEVGLPGTSANVNLSFKPVFELLDGGLLPKPAARRMLNFGDPNNTY